MRRFASRSGWLVPVFLLLIGCSTPESRIKKNPELFASFPEEVKANVKQGLIMVGYTRDMVFIALGEPDRKFVRTTPEGRTEIWSYLDSYETTSRQRVEGTFRVRDNRGFLQTVNDDVWVDVPQQHEFERIRVEMQDGRVTVLQVVDR